MKHYQVVPFRELLSRLWGRRKCIIYGHSWVPWGMDFPEHYVHYIDECRRCRAKRNRFIVED